ncbi:MFS transporter [Novosphingobium pokkalii]|uniref:MFS transporter n=1 Tax=Novosphingobium pokkalii TaxID=1770194 RepID=UPI0036417B52
MSLMVIGYPIGATVGGTIAALLLKSGDWRVVFEFGAIATLVFIPLVFFLVPETPAWFLVSRPADALERANRSLAALRLPAVTGLPRWSRKRRAPACSISCAPACLAPRCC